MGFSLAPKKKNNKRAHQQSNRSSLWLITQYERLHFIVCNFLCHLLLLLVFVSNCAFRFPVFDQLFFQRHARSHPLCPSQTEMCTVCMSIWPCHSHVFSSTPSVTQGCSYLFFSVLQKEERKTNLTMSAACSGATVPQHHGAADSPSRSTPSFSLSASSQSTPASQPSLKRSGWSHPLIGSYQRPGQNGTLLAQLQSKDTNKWRYKQPPPLLLHGTEAQPELGRHDGKQRETTGADAGMCSLELRDNRIICSYWDVFYSEVTVVV